MANLDQSERSGHSICLLENGREQREREREREREGFIKRRNNYSLLVSVPIVRRIPQADVSTAQMRTKAILQTARVVRRRIQKGRENWKVDT